MSAKTIEGITYLPKITAAKMGLDQDAIRAAVPKDGKQVSIMRVYGSVKDVKYGSTDKGEWTRFEGQIEAVNTQTGEIFRSGSLFLPPAVTPFLEGQIIQGKKSEGFIGLQFAFDIKVQKSDVPVGYEYRPINLLGADETDPLLQMRAAFSGNGKKLPK